MSAMVFAMIPILALSIPVIALLGTQLFRPWLDLQRSKLELEAKMVAEKAAQYAAQTERLEQRVRVLERIVTDKGVDLAQEIDRLRDIPLN